MDFKNYAKLIKNNKDQLNQMKLNEKDKNILLASYEELEREHERVINYFNMNTTVYEKEKDLLLKHFIKKDEDVNYLYRELNGYKSTIFYKLFALARKVYRKIFKRKVETK